MDAYSKLTPEPEIIAKRIEQLGRVQVGIKLDALRKCTPRELNHLRDALHTITDVICAQLWSPHFQDEAGQNVLASLNEFMCAYEDMAIWVAKETKPATKQDVQWRCWTILSAEASYAEDLARLSAIAAQAVCEENDAAFDTRHAAKLAVQS